MKKTVILVNINTTTDMYSCNFYFVYQEQDFTLFIHSSYFCGSHIFVVDYDTGIIERIYKTRVILREKERFHFVLGHGML